MLDLYVILHCGTELFRVGSSLLCHSVINFYMF
jgi:hypothetical protein